MNILGKIKEEFRRFEDYADFDFNFFPDEASLMLPTTKQPREW